MRPIDADAFELNVQNEWERNEISNGDWISFRELLKEEPTLDAVELRDVAKMLCDMFGDSCACNYNGIDEWLPYICKYEKSGECPSPNDEYGCWMEFLRNKFGGNDGKND